MPVVGIGGFFFRTRDPEALAEWYRTHLGIVPAEGYGWEQQAGATVFLPFAEDSDAFPAGRGWMLNLRVTELDALVAALRAAGVEVATDPAWDTPETGRFARLADPDGNPLELWEPPAD